MDLHTHGSVRAWIHTYMDPSTYAWIHKYIDPPTLEITQIQYINQLDD